MRILLLSLFFTWGLSLNLLAQRTVTGTVKASEDGSALPGVTVLEKGTTNGAITSADGTYSISVADNAVLIFSYLGYQESEIVIGSRSVIDISLEEDVTALSEVVVTAFGLKKEEKALGYAATVVNGKDLIEARDISVASQLAGKAAGVQVTKPVTGPAGSTNIIIRGISNLSGENRPLLVVDGIPVDNTNLGAAGMWGGRDTGDGFSSLNQDDIEDINIIKGAAAAALFGERGANGAIIITTKKGTNSRGIGVEYNGNYVFENALLLPKFQQTYGQGALGVRPTTTEEARQFSNSWGERFDGESTPFYDGVSRPYSAAGEDDLRNFYETGSTLTNTIALTGGNDKATGRFSFSNLQNTSIIPNTEYEKNAVNLVTTIKLTDRFTVEAKANYIREEALNRPNLSDNPSNPGKSFSSIPANISVEMLRNTVRDDDGNPVQWTDNAFQLNPFWGPFENVNSDRRNRLIGYGKLNYKLTDWLTLQGRYGIDTYNHRFFNIEEDGTAHNVNGALWEDTYEVREENIDFLAMINKDFNQDISFSATLGGIQTRRLNERFGVSGSDFIVVGLHAVNNLANQNPGSYALSKTQTNALFGTGLISYKGILFLDGAIRNDWYSTLTNPNDPENSNNSALYGSGSLSFAFSDLFDMPAFFTFGKLRLAYGSSGNGAPAPYGTALTYGVDGQTYNGVNGPATLGFIGSGVFPNANLNPTRTTSFEAGFDLRFFDNKLSLDLTYYQQNTIDQIFNAAIPNSTGYGSTVLNAGDVENKGVEIVLSGTPIKTNDFSWNISANFTSNVNTVKELADGIDNLSGEGARFSANLLSEVGGRVGDIFGTVLMRNENGEVVHDVDGLPMIETDRQVLGNFAPDWYGGITNSFTYKNLSFGFLIDIKQGGEIYSLTNAFAYSSGKHFNTLEGRENSNFEIVGQGVGPDGTSANSAPARLDQYYARFAQAASENIFDASYIKLRQVSIGYMLPNKVIANTPFYNVRFSVVGRNMFFFKNGLSEIGVDPEALYSLSNSGFEYGTTPSTRTFGFNITAKL